MEDLKGQSKGQKLASAIYFVTSFFDDKEPLKWRLRNLGLDLATLGIRDKNSISKEIITLLIVAKNTNLISDVNYGIFSTELSKFNESLESPLNKMFFEELKSAERTLSPVESPLPIKDKTVESKREERPVLRSFGVVSVKKNNRQSVIIGLLKRKKEIMIKDLSPLIQDCSEKTIQRELLGMVASGILRKAGEKRWSRYSLA